MTGGGSGTTGAKRTLTLASVAHALHDGYRDMIYVLLPIWQMEFSLDYAALTVVRVVYVGILAALQVPSAHLAKHLNPRTVLALGTLLSAAGYAVAGHSGGLAGLTASWLSLVSAAARSIRLPPVPCHGGMARGHAVRWAYITSRATSARRRFNH